MIIKTYSHNSGRVKIPESINEPLFTNLESINIPFKRKGAPNIRKTILCNLKSLGWSDRVPIDANSKVTITAVNHDIGLCLQLGNTARFYADLLKLELFYENGRILAAIYIIPTSKAASMLGDNVANFNRLTHELNIYRHIIKIPILVIGIEGV